MTFTAGMIGKRNVDCINGRKWVLEHLRDLYGSGSKEIRRALKHFCKVAQEMFPRKRNTNYFYIISWTDNEDISYQNIADVLNETVRRMNRKSQVT